MRLDPKIIDAIIFKSYDNSLRFTQDSPVYPDAWLEYFQNASIVSDYRTDLILTPHRNASAAELFKGLSQKLRNETQTINLTEIASSGEFVVAKLTLIELVRYALPMTQWWQNNLRNSENEPTAENRWLTILLGAILYAAVSDAPALDEASIESVVSSLEKFFYDRFDRTIVDALRSDRRETDGALLWAVNRNRPAGITMEKSIGTTKADATRKLFDIDGSGITWAILDTGVDATHPAFIKRDPKTKEFYQDALGAPEDRNSNHTRIVASYDFTKFRSILAEIYRSISLQHVTRLLPTTADNYDKKLEDQDASDYIREIERDLNNGRVLDWTIISPLLRIPLNAIEYVSPLHPHGTHVAGIVGAGQFNANGTPKLVGMCPGIDLYDIRVLDKSGNGDEFNILAALQFVRWLNNQKDGQVIHGVNLSFSMVHTVASYACGATPVCESCERLVSDGTVVVAAAGNLGQALYQNTSGISSQGFRMVNITDPGNAEGVITVGSTHRNRPHSYGISYFSSKGPTGDGRIKPDLVAPGEKIISCVLSKGTDRMDGTSMAAPHVSGAAALILAKHSELVGRPKRVKEILCKTATDLGRERYFQGCGMVDVLRAIQSV